MKKIFTSLTCLCVMASQVQAGGYRVSLQGQKQIGMGHAGSALALDASSVFFNPGAAAFTPNSLSIGGTYLMPRVQFLDAATQTRTDAVANNGTPFNAYATFGLPKKFNLGIGVYTPYGSTLEYPVGWTGRYSLTSIALQAINIQPTLSYKINKNFGIGAGFIYSSGSVRLEKDLPLSTQTNLIGHSKLEGDASGMGYKLGAYFQKNKVSVGLSYQSKVSMHAHKQSATFTNIPASVTSSFPTVNTFTTTLPLPGELTLGLGYKATKQLTVAVDYIFTQWSAYDSLLIDFGTKTSQLDISRSARLYKNTNTIRLGGNYMVNKKLDVRAGAFYDQSPIKDGYVTPESPDNNRLGGTLGASYSINPAFSIDASYMYQSVPERLQTNIETNLGGTFASRVNSVGVGVTYNFGKYFRAQGRAQARANNNAGGTGREGRRARAKRNRNK
jgi:long-chain fatty acid transport protein